MLALLLAAAAHPAPPPVFTRDIAPILYKHCDLFIAVAREPLALERD